MEISFARQRLFFFCAKQNKAKNYTQTLTLAVGKHQNYLTEALAPQLRF
jgi:hypothetical protein